MVQFTCYMSSFSLIPTTRSISAVSYPFLPDCLALFESQDLTISFMESNELTDFASRQRSKYAAETEQTKDD